MICTTHARPNCGCARSNSTWRDWFGGGTQPVVVPPDVRAQTQELVQQLVQQGIVPEAMLPSGLLVREPTVVERVAPYVLAFGVGGMLCVLGSALTRRL